MKYLLAIVGLLLVLFPVATIAQDAPTCDVAAVVDSTKANLNAVTDLESLVSAAASLRVSVAECSGLYFSGKNAKTIGPITLTKGLYNAVLTTKGFFIAEIQTIGGNCKPNSKSVLFNLASGQASDGSESPLNIEADTCSFIIATSNVTSNWTLEIEPLAIAQNDNVDPVDVKALANLIEGSLSLSAKDILILSVDVADGRQNGGELVALITYQPSSSEVSIFGAELIQISLAVEIAVRGIAKLDSISVIIANSKGSAIGTVSIQMADVELYVSGDISALDLINRMKSVVF